MNRRQRRAQQAQGVGIKIDPMDIPPLRCTAGECRSSLFTKAWEIRPVSKIQMPPDGGKIELEVYRCIFCGNILNMQQAMKNQEVEKNPVIIAKGAPGQDVTPG